MTAQPFFVGPTDGGMINAVEPWLLPDQAFQNLFNCYQYRGRVERKYGSSQLGRLVNAAGTYSNTPVMGLLTYETSNINQEKLIGLSQTYANIFNTTGVFTNISFDTTGAAITWTGTDSDFFWGWNYSTDASGNKLLWTTNNVRADRIRYFNGSLTQGWTIFRPTLNTTASRHLDTALMIVSYRGRLIFLNTKEADGLTQTTHPQRARWSWLGDPLNANAFDDTTPGRGGYIDAPTAEAIVSCGFFKDTLVVFFERSTWQLFYTQDSTAPFSWYRINTQFGSESTFSTIPFDQGLFSIGDKGIILSDTLNVQRIDQKIPYQVFSIHNGNNGLKRVQGIRDYFYQFAYWTYPNADNNPTYPNRVLSFNYLENSFSVFKESFTRFGYYQSISDLTWATSTFPWSDAGSKTWISSVNQSEFPSIVAGNQQGFVFIVYESGQNDPSLYITNIVGATKTVTSPNHNLEVGDYIKISDVTAWAPGVTVTGKITSVGVNTFILDTALTNGADGFITVLDNYEVLTKRYNPFFNKGSKARMSFLDMFIDRTNTGEFSIDIIIDETGEAIETDIVETNQNYGTSSVQEKMIQRVYTNATGQFIQMKMYLSDIQMKDANIQNQYFRLHAMNLWMSDSGRIVSYDHR